MCWKIKIKNMLIKKKVIYYFISLSQPIGLI